MNTTRIKIFFYTIPLFCTQTFVHPADAAAKRQTPTAEEPDTSLATRILNPKLLVSPEEINTNPMVLYELVTAYLNTTNQAPFGGRKYVGYQWIMALQTVRSLSPETVLKKLVGHGDRGTSLAKIIVADGYRKDPTNYANNLGIIAHETFMPLTGDPLATIIHSSLEKIPQRLDSEPLEFSLHMIPQKS